MELIFIRRLICDPRNDPSLQCDECGEYNPVSDSRNLPREQISDALITQRPSTVRRYANELDCNSYFTMHPYIKSSSLHRMYNFYLKYNIWSVFLNSFQFSKEIFDSYSHHVEVESRKKKGFKTC